MIKRILFVTRRADLTASEFQERWLRALAEVDELRPETRPRRMVACTVAHEVTGADTPHDGLSMEWFDDIDAARWERAQPREAMSLVDPGATLQILADEVVMRGTDWLVRRWITREVTWKHMALARRAPGLSRAEFSERWRNRPGRIGAASAVVEIPAEARGRAYVQNHPLANDASEPPYDAINEAYFDDLESMRERLAFFRRHDVERADAELVSEPRFIVVREHVIR